MGLFHWGTFISMEYKCGMETQDRKLDGKLLRQSVTKKTLYKLKHDTKEIKKIIYYYYIKY